MENNLVFNLENDYHFDNWGCNLPMPNICIYHDRKKYIVRFFFAIEKSFKPSIFRNGILHVRRLRPLHGIPSMILQDTFFRYNVCILNGNGHTVHNCGEYSWSIGNDFERKGKIKVKKGMEIPLPKSELV